MDWPQDLQHPELPAFAAELFREYSFAFDVPAAEGSEPAAAPSFASPFDRPSQDVRNARSNSHAPFLDLNAAAGLRRSSSLPSDLSFLKSLGTLPCSQRQDLVAPVTSGAPSSINLIEYRDGLPASADLRMLPDRFTAEPGFASNGVLAGELETDAAAQSSSSDPVELQEQQERLPDGPRSKLLGAVYEACTSQQQPDLSATPVAETCRRMQLRSQALVPNPTKRQRTSLNPHRHQQRVQPQRSHSFSEFTDRQARSDGSPQAEQLDVAAGGTMKVEGRPVQISWPRRDSPPPQRELQNRVIVAPAPASSSSSGQPVPVPEGVSSPVDRDTFNRPFRVQIQSHWGPTFFQGQQYGRQYDALQDHDYRMTTGPVIATPKAQPNRIVTRSEWNK